MRAFVTGAGGFLGSHLVRRLARDGADVRALAGDLFDPRAWDGARDADVIFHLAATSFVPDTLRDPEGAVRVNVLGTERALDAAHRAGARFVFASTSHVYAPRSDRPLREEDVVEPRSPYAATKAAGEALVHAYRGTFGLATTIARLFNVYGPGQRADFLVPTILAQARTGSEVKLGDVTPVRDFVFVEDAVDLLARAGTSPAAAGQTFNVATGVGTSVREVAERAIAIVSPGARLAFDASRARAAEVSRLVGDPSRARDALGWTPRHSLDEGLRRAASETAT